VPIDSTRGPVSNSQGNKVEQLLPDLEFAKTPRNVSSVLM